jgi:DNA-binding SARP family transcriptional activator
VKETKSARNNGSLLTYAISRLSPDIFSHPVWVRFGQKGVSDSPAVIANLMSAAKKLEDNEPSAACQILLLCAFFQNCAGQPHNAVLITQKALTLAQRTKLSRETTWSISAACAFFIQQRDFEGAASYFVDLQATLSEQNEWILASYVDVLRQTFLRPGIRNTGNPSGSPHDNVFEDMITLTLDWFQHWGFTTQLDADLELAPEHSELPVIEQPPMAHSLSSTQQWPGRWHILMLAIRGELRLQWTRDDSPPVKRRFSFWGAILGSLRLFFRRGNVDTQVHDDPPQAPTPALLPPVNQAPPPAIEKSRKEKVTKTPASRKRQQSKRANNIVPVTVHMLGTFRIAIGDAPVKIPSSRSLSLFKYLLIHHKQAIHRELLMDKFWPDAEPETARNSLNVAIHSLRQHLHTVSDVPVIVFEAGAYGLAPNLQVWIDVEEFERAHQTGHRLETRNQLSAAIAEYECAISLYQGDLLEESPYEEWMILDRERLRIAYLETLDRLSQIYFEEEHYSACRTACQLILIKDPCREDAHCLLMRCYSRQRQPHLALYQYQICVEALRGELQVEPAPETTQLYNRIRRREQV